MPVSRTLRLIGPFEIEPDDRSATRSVRRKPRALLGYLAVTNRVHRRRALAALFCGEANDPGAALRSLLSRIRSQFGPDLLLIEPDTVRFDPTSTTVDYREFVEVLGHKPDERPTPDIIRALELHRGELLEGLSLSDAPEFDIWLLGEQSRCQQIQARGLRVLIDRHVESGGFDDAIERARQLVESDPLAEDAHGRLMWLYARVGHRQAALAQFETCRDTLARELAVEPSSEVTAVYERIRDGRIGRSPTVPSLTPESDIGDSHAPDFVGRDEELATLVTAWGRAAHKQGCVALVGAQAGGGKTRLVMEFTNAAGTQRLDGPCYEFAATRPFHPWIDLIQSCLESESIDDTFYSDLSRLTQDYLARLVPALAARFNTEAPADLPTTSGEMERLLSAVTELLFALPRPREHPLVVFIDNLQWADDASLRLFHFLSARARTRPVLLVGAYRSEELDDAPALRQLLDDLRHESDTVHLVLTPLDRDAISQYVMARRPDITDAATVDALAGTLEHATGGNPLFLSEVLNDLGSATALPQAVPVPETVVELVGRRLRRFSDSARQVLEALAVLGSPATLELVQRTSARNEDETLVAVDTGLRWGLLASARDATSRYDFRHDLLRDAVRVQVTDVRRQLLHRRAARSLELDAAPAAILAYHFQESGDTDRFAHYATIAGRGAMGVYANEDAIKYLAAAADHLTEPARQMDVLTLLAKVRMRVGDIAGAVETLRRALGIAEAAGKPAWRGSIETLLGSAATERGEYDDALRWFERSRQSYEDAGDRLRTGHQIGSFGIVHWQRGEFESALSAYEEAERIAHEVEDTENLAVWPGNIGLVYWQMGRHEEAHAALARALAIHRDTDNREGIATTVGNIGNVYTAEGNYPEAARHFGEAAVLDEALGRTPGVARHVGNLYEIYSLTGHTEWSIRCVLHGLRLYETLGDLQGIGRLTGGVSAYHLRRGDAERARAWCQLSLDTLQHIDAKFYIVWRQMGMVEIQAALGNLEEADERLAAAASLAAEHNPALEMSARRWAVVLDHTAGRIDDSTAIQRFLALADETTGIARARSLYEVWDRDPGHPTAGREAAEALRAWYLATGEWSERTRYEAITGDNSLSAPEFPPPPDFIDSLPEDPDAALNDYLQRLSKQQQARLAAPAPSRTRPKRH